MPVQRLSPALHLPGATEFSADRELLSPLWVVKMMKQTQWLYRELEDSTCLDKNWGRSKEPGSWALAYLAFVVSDCRAAVEKWWADSNSELWRECGFTRRPSYQTTYERFVELETVSGVFAEVAGKLIRHCRKHDAQIGAHIHVDGTEAETHAALVHDCQPGEGCHWGWAKPSRTAKRPRRVSTEVVRAERQKDAEREPDDSGAPEIGDADEIEEMPDGRLRIRVGQHWYRTLDSTAGVRAYTGPRGAKRFWHGFYNEKAIDHYTGAPLAVGVFSASRQEYDCYPELFERLQAALGGNPETVIADKGFSVESVFELNTSLGVASVIPWRKRGRQEQRQDKDSHDRHGIPRCKHCGGETKFVRFRVEERGPRLWFRCVSKPPTCSHDEDQSIQCKQDWRLLLPLWRTDPLYHELRSSHSNYERVHRHWRERYLVAGENLDTRPKRRGIACQELRAQAAILVEWLRIAWREGWLGSARRNQKTAKANSSRGAELVKKLRSFRVRAGLTIPYGPQAHALGVGLLEPPSRRSLAPPGPEPPDDGGDSIPF